MHIDEPEEEQGIVLRKCKQDPEVLAYYLGKANKKIQDSRRQKILKLLTENPDKNRVHITDTTADSDDVILTFAIRGVATFNMLTPKNKYDSFVLKEIIGK